MHCENCGRSTEEMTRFCVECERFIRETAATLEEGEVSQKMQSADPVTNEYVQKGKALSKDYWRFFHEHLKAPIQGESAGVSQLTNASINILLLSLLSGFGLYFDLKNLSFLGADVSFKTVLAVFVYMIAACVVSAILLFGVAKLLMNVDVKFKTVLARFGALVTVPTAFSALYFLASLPGMVTLASLFQLLMLVGLQIAILTTLFSFRKAARSSFDPIFGMLVFYAVFGLLFWVSRGCLPSMFLGTLLK